MKTEIIQRMLRRFGVIVQMRVNKFLADLLNTQTVTLHVGLERRLLKMTFFFDLNLPFFHLGEGCNPMVSICKSFHIGNKH